MGRTALQAGVETIPVNDDYLESTGNAVAVLHQQEVQALERAFALSREIGFQGPIERRSLEDESKFLVERTAECALELGKRLLLLKEMSVHGEWLPTLERIGVTAPAASRIMGAARRLANVATSQHLLEAAKSKNKLFELMVLDDDELQAIAEGESAAGLTLDDVDRMSVRELRATLREAKAVQKEALAAKDRVIEQQQNAVTRMQEKVATLEHRAAVATPDEVRLALTTAFNQATEMTRSTLHTSFEIAARKLIDHGAVIGSPEDEHIAGVLRKLARDLVAVGGRLGVEVGIQFDDFSWAKAE